MYFYLNRCNAKCVIFLITYFSISNFYGVAVYVFSSKKKKNHTNTKHIASLLFSILQEKRLFLFPLKFACRILANLSKISHISVYGQLYTGRPKAHT